MRIYSQTFGPSFTEILYNQGLLKARALAVLNFFNSQPQIIQFSTQTQETYTPLLTVERGGVNTGEDQEHWSTQRVSRLNGFRAIPQWNRSKILHPLRNLVPSGRTQNRLGHQFVGAEIIDGGII